MTDSRLERAAQLARQNIPIHDSNSKEVEIYKLRGRTGEELAQEELNGANLNDLTGRSNFANYDIVSSEHISSVKVKGLTEDGEPRYSDYNKFFADIVNPNAKANQQAAKDMLEALKDNPELAQHLPNEIAKAETQDGMAQALADKSILQIPYDQVDSVRENLYNRVVKSPADYGLGDDCSPSDLETGARNLVDNRIQPIVSGQYSSHDIGKAAANVYEQGHTVENAPSDSNLAKGTNIELPQPSPPSASETESESESYSYGYGYGY